VSIAINFSLSLIPKSQTMKKITLLLVAAAMISGGAMAQDKCCKKGHKCTEKSACCKDNKNCDKNKAKANTTSKTQETKTEANKAKS
jgi:hypothetical protein